MGMWLWLRLKGFGSKLDVGFLPVEGKREGGKEGRREGGRERGKRGGRRGCSQKRGSGSLLWDLAREASFPHAY